MSGILVRVSSSDGKDFLSAITPRSLFIVLLCPDTKLMAKRAKHTHCEFGENTTQQLKYTLKLFIKVLMGYLGTIVSAVEVE